MNTISRESMLKILRECTEQGAVEIHFKVPNRPLMRMANGMLVPTKMQALGPADVKSAVFALCALGQVELPVARISDDEFSFGINGLGRFRAFVYRQRGSLGAVVRRVATAVPTLSDLGLDATVEQHVGQPGLVLVAGTMRTEVLHALVSGYNARARGNVVILETPLTYLHRDAMAAISHREVGTDVPDFPTAISQAIRLGTDLLALGEIEDATTADRMLCAAERRMPVVATVAAPVAEDASWWISRMFFGEARADIERRLATLLVSVVCVTDVTKPEVLVTKRGAETGGAQRATGTGDRSAAA